MIIVPIKEGENIEKALNELRARKAFVKPSVKRREEIKKAIYVQHLKLMDEQ